LLLRPLAYRVHPYQWSTIGKEISHIENATIDDVKSFYCKYYHPSNAILTIAGNVTMKEVQSLSLKWFGPIQSGKKQQRKLIKEPAQTEDRMLKVDRKVPFDSIYKAYHMCARKDPQYHSTDLMSDILSNGFSSRLYISLVKEKRIFSEIHAFISGDMDEGLFVINGKLMKNIKMDAADKAIINELEKIMQNPVEETELQKVKNKIESTLQFSEISVLDKAMNLSYSELLGDAGNVNKEIEKYQAITRENIIKTAQEVFRPGNCSTLYYFSS
jgi:predicted Zn-dependent peptidase